MGKKRKYVSPLLLLEGNLDLGDDPIIVIGGSMGTAGKDWALPCSTWDTDFEGSDDEGNAYGYIYDNFGWSIAYGPYDPSTPGAAWQLEWDLSEEGYFYIKDGDYAGTYEVGQMVDFNTLSAIYEAYAYGC